MKAEKQTSEHLLLASVVTVFSLALILIMIVMLWELWMIPLIAAGAFGVWFLYIERTGSKKIYENLCSGLILVEFLFFGVHNASLFDIPAVACIVIFIFSMLDRKRLLYMTAALYVLEILYHILFLHTITYRMSIHDVMRLGVGALVVIGAVEIARYRINRRLVERQRHSRTLAQLETAGRQNVVFLSNVSHEFRTPINMVLGISEIMLEKDISSEIREDIQSIQLAGKRLSSQISNILDYTEIVEGSLIPAKEEYTITSITNDVITTTAIRGGKNHLEFVFDVDPKIPSVLIGDPEKISHILKTVLENSIKFTEEGGVNVCIGFRRESYGANLIIDIYDTGIGMTDFQISQIYNDFYQADSGSSRFSGGIGLGIPIVQGILHAMGGFIHFESNGQQGLHAHMVVPQGVANDMPVLAIPHAEDLCIACYFRPEKYSCDEVRSYYDKLILHLVEGLNIEGYQAHNFEGLLKLQRSHDLTHVFIAQAEYQENSSYYEELTSRLQVVVIAEKDFMLSRESQLLVIRKPFSAFSVVNLLNGEMRENGFKEAQAVGDKPFSCVGVRVLVVDDEEMNLVVAKGVLGSYGIQVETCLSGKEAIERCGSTSYDIIFLDHMMPGFDGVETLRRIREMRNGLYQELPVVALTANTISGAREMFRNEGFTEFVPKPIERAVLERVLRRILPARCIEYNKDNLEYNSLIFSETSADENNSLNDIPSPDVAEENTTSLPYAQLVQAGIHVEKGLDYCCGDEEFYLEMLRIFYSQSGEKMDELVSLYEAANWKDYATKAHALKSTSLTIGAEKLSNYAKTLEQAGKSGDMEYIHTHHPELLRMYREVCENIAGV
jgi:signal transduction histidine kinase/CheY-like chemotaxis protein/HPt (histidine-containing phosphotransfer) domain-containing protein